MTELSELHEAQTRANWLRASKWHEERRQGHELQAQIDQRKAESDPKTSSAPPRP